MLRARATVGGLVGQGSERWAVLKERVVGCAQVMLRARATVGGLVGHGSERWAVLKERVVGCAQVTAAAAGAAVAVVDLAHTLVRGVPSKTGEGLLWLLDV
eukprot:366341-Chlamydomonas_euryale.AAC.6